MQRITYSIEKNIGDGYTVVAVLPNDEKINIKYYRYEFEAKAVVGELNQYITTLENVIINQCHYYEDSDDIEFFGYIDKDDKEFNTILNLLEENEDK